jgi:hypothetical protein
MRQPKAQPPRQQPHRPMAQSASENAQAWQRQRQRQSHQHRAQQQPWRKARRALGGVPQRQ